MEEQKELPENLALRAVQFIRKDHADLMRYWILEEAKKRENFPELEFGIRRPADVDATEDVITALFTGTDKHLLGALEKHKGILVYDGFQLYHPGRDIYRHTEQVILQPDGLFTFSVNYFMKADDNDRKICLFPDFSTKQENSLNYIIHSETALQTLDKLVKKS